jgi:hypothetical protein
MNDYFRESSDFRDVTLVSASKSAERRACYR